MHFIGSKEEELVALEASVERTRALLTEKFKRLRLMHQTLDAALNIPLDQNMVLASQESSPTSSAGTFSSLLIMKIYEMSLHYSTQLNREHSRKWAV